MRKKLSPAVVVICLFALTAGILCVMFYLQSAAMKRVYGNEIRKDIFRINDLTGTVMEALTEDGDGAEDNEPSSEAAELLFAAGEMERCDLGGRIHELYDELRRETIQAVRDFAESRLGNGDAALSEEAAERLADRAYSSAERLRGATQFLMSELNSTDTNKMDAAYYKAMDVNAKIYKRLTTYINTYAGEAE